LNGESWAFNKGFGITIFDNLDTLYIMGLTDELERARQWTAAYKTPSVFAFYKASAPFFEVVIRSLGGLLSAYDLTGDVLFLNKAKELGECLFNGAFAQNGVLPKPRSFCRHFFSKNKSTSSATNSKVSTTKAI
jgi:mannosyl-oligosaccharide alpha-1,2-mannosidase